MNTPIPMKRTQGLFLAAMILTAITSCEKRNDTGITAPLTKPDLTEKVTTAIAGFITDEANAPMIGAKVQAGDKQATTDEFGYFSLQDVSLPEVAGVVKVEKAAYFTGYKTFQPAAGKETFLRMRLLPAKSAGTIEAVSGGTLTTTDGVKITLPANGVVNSGNGVAYTGNVAVHVHKIDPVNAEQAQLSLPGDDRGTDVNGYLKILKSFSSVAVELIGDDGGRLQIAAGKQATIEMPIPAGLVSIAPPSIDLWSFNEANGLWKQEGVATKTGNNYTAAVSHFSFWSGATGLPLVNFRTKIINSDGQPLVHVPVVITIAGAQHAGFGKFAWTDGDGLVQGAVISGMNLALDVMTPCATSAYSHTFTAANNDIDLGTLTGNLGQGMVSISGTVTNCNNAPVTNGYVQTYDNGFYNRINIVNGGFSFTGLACTNTEMYYVAVDKDANQQSTPASRTLAAGANSLGALSACGASTVGVISYTVNDGDEQSLIEPAEPLAGYYSSLAGGWTTVLSLGQGSNTNPKWSFQFTGTAGITGEHKVTEVFSNGFPGGRVYAPVPLTVTITEYGNPGGFIAGSFSGLMLGFSDNSIQHVTCHFRVRRMNL